MQTVTLHGLHWACEVDEPPPGSTAGAAVPLVLIHGFPMDRRVWQDVATLTSRNRRTLRPDLPGFGRSDAATFTIESAARDLHEVLGKLGAIPAAVAGLSMGGYVALEMARQFPADVVALALVDSRADADDEQARRKRDQMIRLVRRSGTHAVVDQMLPKLLSPATQAQRPEVAPRLRRIMLETPAETIAISSAAMRDRRDQRDLLAKLAMPAAVLVGEFDEITLPAASRAMAEMIPCARYSEIPGAGHMAPLENPQKVAEELDRLLERL